MTEKQKEIQIILLESIWVMRWSENKTGLYAVLTEEEAEIVCNDIIINLNMDGYKIVKKINIQCILGLIEGKVRKFFDWVKSMFNKKPF